MPNNFQILAYIQAMKDEIDCKIDTVFENKKIVDRDNVFRGLKTYKKQLANLEKFIKGGNHNG
jgi:hypothetical protein